MARNFTQSVLFIISFLALSQQVFGQTANAGPDQTRCNGLTNATLAGNTPNIQNTGTWSIVSGGTGAFANPASPTTTFTPTSIPAGSTNPYVLRWTIEPGLVISQIYTGGGLASATYQNDFVELHNRSSQGINLNGKSIQYSSAAGTFATAVALSNVTIPAGGFYLVQLASDGANGATLTAPNQTSTAINMSLSQGKIALVNQTAALGCGSTATVCTGTQTGLIIDMVTYGTVTGLNQEGPSITTALTSSTSARRSPVGTACNDTNNNNADFVVGTVLNNVRNGSSTAQLCPALNTTDDVTITFVNILTTNTVAETSGTANDGTVSCGASATITALGTGTYSWTSNPVGFTATTASINVTPTLTTTYTCTVTGSNGCTAQTSRIITVNAITAATTVTETSGTANDGTICNGSSASIAATSGMASYTWTSNPAGFTSTAGTINVSPTVTTIYNVTITNTSGCKASTTRTITVPVVTAGVNVTETSAGVNNDGTICSGASATLTGTGGTTYAWSPATGLSATTGTTVTASPTMTTTYTVTATNAQGCTSTFSRTITVNPLPVASTTVTETSGTPDDGTICFGQSATIAASGGGTYSWTSTPTGFTSVASTINVSPTVNTTYNLTVTTGGCTSTTTRTITVDNPASAITVTETSGATNDDGIVCSGVLTTLSVNAGAASYEWESNPVGLSSTSNSVLVAPLTTTNYSVSVTGASGCVGIASRTVTVVNANITLTETSGDPNDAIICSGGSAALAVQNIPNTTYSWTSNPAGLALFTAAITVTPPQSSTYNIVVTHGDCVVGSNIDLDLNPIPISTVTVTEASGNAQNDGAICNGTSATIAIEPNQGSYVWASVPAGFTSTLSTITVTPTITTSYRVTITGGAGCTASTIRDITVNANPVLTPISATEASGTANDGFVCPNTTVTLTTSSAGATFAWTSIPSGFTATTASVTVTSAATRQYNVVATSTAGCTAEASRTIETFLSRFTFAETSGTANDGTVCSNTPTTITALAPGATFSWASPVSTMSSIMVSPTVTTTYIVTASVAGASGCTVTNGITVNVLQAQAFCKDVTLKLNTPTVILNVADVNNGSLGTLFTVDKNTFSCLNIGANSVKLKASNDFCVDSCTAIVTISDGPGCNPTLNPTAPDKPSITDPCLCKGTATTLTNGQFRDKVSVLNAFSGERWVVKNVSGYYKLATVGGQDPLNPVLVGDILTEVSLGGGRSDFELSGFHIDSVGYKIEVWRLDAFGNGIPGSELNTSNRCFYPTPVYRPRLPLVVPTASPSITLNAIDINAKNNTGATVTYSGTGVIAGVFNPTAAGTGTHTISSTLNYGNPAGTRTGQDITMPVCASTITQLVTVADITPSLTCKSFVNYTLEKDCSVSVLAGDFLLGAPLGFGGYEALIMQGNNVITSITTADVGKTFTVKVSDLSNPKNSCWSSMKVEDKTAPIIDCTSNRVFNCEDDVKLNLSAAPIEATPANVGAFVVPVITECSKYKVTYFDQGQNGGCSDSYVFNGQRIYTVIDEYGNASTCSVPFEIKRRFIIDVIFPADITLSCSDVKTSTVSLAQGKQPTILGKNLDKLQGCGISATYTDAITQNSCGIGFTVRREWVVSSPCDNTPRTQVQVISVKDFTPPTILSLAADISAAINTNDCLATGIALPMPTVTDNCDGNPTVSILVKDGNGKTVGSGNIIWTIGVGNYTVFYTVTDACGNRTFANRPLTIKDENAPKAACRVNVEVSLARTDANVIDALSLDAGSSDNCCLDVNRYEIKRMSESDAAFKPTLNVKCSDIGKDNMIVLRVWDCNGNSNICMTNLFVFDKLPPLVVPENITVTCGNDATAKVWLDDHPLKKLNQAPTAAQPGYFDHETSDPTCIVNAVVTKVIDSLDNCGNGFYAYEWTVTDQSGNKTVAQQRYVSSNNSLFSVTFPKDTTIILSSQCDSVGTAPSITGIAEVSVSAGACPVIAKEYFDQASKLSGDSICFTITRVWRVSNLCKPMPATAQPYVSHIKGKNVTVTSNDINNGYFEYLQKINVIDLTPPKIVKVNPVVIEPIDKECRTKVTFNEMDVKDCSGQKTKQTFTVSKANGQIVATSSNVLPATIEFNSKDFGDYKVVYQVTDECGNASVTTELFKVKDVLKPTPVCHDNIAIDLGTTGTAMLMANIVDAGSFDNCTEVSKLKIRIRVLTDSIIIKNDTVKVNPDTLPSMVIMKCPPKGTPSGTTTQWSVQLWVGDEAGNWDYCITSVDLQDNMLACNYDPNEMRPLEVAIINEKGKEVEGVNVQLNGTKTMSFLSNKIGKVKFNDLPVSGTYQVIPEKKNFPMNGVSTYDLVLISKHILGVQQLSTPYQYIAADVNRSNTITTSDIVELRKMILAVQNDFTKNTAWRFIDQAYQFPNPKSPFNPAFPEKVNLNGVAASAIASFIGVKIGDVNASASTSNFTTPTPRSLNTTYFNAEEKAFVNGEVFTANFASQEQLDGYQFTFDFDKNVLDLVDIQEHKDGFGIIENGTLTSSHVLTDNSEAKFSLVFKAKKAGKLSETVKVTSRLLNAEAYDKAGNINNVTLNFNNKTVAKFELYQNQPNPFNGTTTIGFSLPESGSARLVISDVAGKVLKVINGEFNKGYNQISVEKADLGLSGVLYYSLETATQTATKKMIIVE